MKNLKPTLVFLFALCIFNFLKAQERLENKRQKPTTEDKFLDASEEPELSQRLLPVSYTYNDGWLPSSPIGVATSIDAIILESGTVNITANTVCDKLIVNAGATLTIASGVTLTAPIIDLHSTTQLFSSLVSDGIIVGVVRYHRHTAQVAPIGTNDLISSPVSGQLFEAFDLTNTNLPDSGFIRAFAPYNTSVGAYQNYNVLTNALTVIESGVGYRTATTDGGTLTFTGVVRTDDVLDIPISGAEAGGAWNLIGNPYPSYLDFDAFFTQNKSQLDLGGYQAIYGYDGDASDGWTVWNQATIDSPAITELIAPGQAFYVKSKSEGGLIDFTKAMRCAGSSDDFILGRTSTSPHHGHIQLNLSSGSSDFNTDFYFNSNATLDFDTGYDASLYSPTAPSFSIYSHLVENNSGIPLAVQALNPDAMYDVVVPLGIKANQGQEVTISISETDMPTDIDIYLEDNLNNSFTLLNTGDYVFTAGNDLTGTGRFYLRFEGEALGTIKSTKEDISIYTKSVDKIIVIDGQLQQNTIATLYDVNGRVVLSNV